jgi:hypothetical protein
MAEARLSFDEEFGPQIVSTCNTVVNHMQEKTTEVKSSSVDAAEKLLDEACNKCIATFTSKIEDIRASVKRVKPNPSSPTHTEDDQKYLTYLDAVKRGIEKSQNLFDAVIERIRNIVSTVLECIKAGIDCIWKQLAEAFTSVKSLWTSYFFS